MNATALVVLALGTTFAVGTANAGGEDASLVGEDSGSFFLSAQMYDTGQTRAQVRAAAVAARTSGEAMALLCEDSGSFYLSRANGSCTVSRAQVREKLLQSRASGEIAARVGENSDSDYLNLQVPEHWTRYAGPDIGCDREASPHEAYAACRRVQA